MQIMLFILFHAVSLSQSQKFIFKIEHKTPENETIFNEYEITFVNGTNENKHNSPKTNEKNPNKIVVSFNTSRNNHPIIDSGNNKATDIYSENDKDNEDPNLTIDRNIYYNTEVIPFVQRKRDDRDIKRQLDNFQMKRKESYLTTVDFYYNLPTRINWESSPIPLRGWKVRNERNTRDRPMVSQEIDFNSIFTDPEMSNVMKRQNNLLNKLDKILRKEIVSKGRNKVLRHSVSNLLEDLKRVKNMTTVKQVVIGPSTKRTTVLTVVDETAVREALKNDPLVRRILKMGKDKRDKYEYEVKELIKA